MADRSAESPSDLLEKYEAELRRLPESGLLHHGRGLALLSLNHLDEAQNAFARALERAPRHADIWVGVGEMHRVRNDNRAARMAFWNALSIDDLTPGAWQGFCAVSGWITRWVWTRRLRSRQVSQETRRRDRESNDAQVIDQSQQLAQAGYYAEAIDNLRKFLEKCPGNISVTATLCALLAMLGNVEQGRQKLEQLVRWWPESALAHYFLGSYLGRMGEKEAAIKLLRRALVLDPEDHAKARFALATLGAESIPELPVEEVRSLFDNYAENFDSDLRDNLEYRIPELIASFMESDGRHWKRMLDLGCGTGLCGVTLKPYVDYMVGIDLSAKMIEKAHARSIYDVLHENEALGFLCTTTENFDLIVAADVLVYISNVPLLFQEIAKRLELGGEFWFSVELPERDGAAITMARRYQHSAEFLESIARAVGLRMKYQLPTDIRRHGVRMLKGLLVAMVHA